MLRSLKYLSAVLEARRVGLKHIYPELSDERIEEMLSNPETPRRPSRRRRPVAAKRRHINLCPAAVALPRRGRPEKGHERGELKWGPR